MFIEFDSDKNEHNIKLRGLDFELAYELDWESAIIDEDTRKNYGERRYQATGYIGKCLYVVIYTLRHPKLRVISLRKANRKEIKKYEKETR